MQTKLIFFDIDGTLIDEKTGTIPPSTIQAILQAQANGHLCFINTGRPFSTIDSMITDIPFDGYICGCGTYIQYHHQPLFHAQLNTNLKHKVIQSIYQHQVDAMLEGYDGVYFSKNLRFSLTEDEIGKIKVIHPPLEEQKKIADFLDDKCAQIDEITKDLEEKISKLDEYKKEIVFEAVTKGLNSQAELKDSGIYWIGKVPSHWKVVKGKYCFDNDKEIVGARVDQYERLALTLNGVIKRSKDDNEGLQPKDFATYQILRKDELVFKLIDLQNISTSRVGLSPYVGLVSPAYIILKSRSNTYPSYAERFYLMMWYNQIFNHLGDDGVRSGLNASELLNLPFVLPPLEEQKKIADFLDDKCAQIDEITKTTREEIETLKQYKQSLIYEYVTGKKEVPNE